MSDARAKARADARMIERNLAHDRLHRPPTEEILAMMAARAIENNPALMHSRSRGQNRRDSIARMEEEEERGWLDRRVAEVMVTAAEEAAREREERELARPAYIESLGRRVRDGSPTARTLSQFDLLGRYGEGDVIRPAAAVIGRVMRNPAFKSAVEEYSSTRAVPAAEAAEEVAANTYLATAPVNSYLGDATSSSSSDDEEEEGEGEDSGSGRVRHKSRKRSRSRRNRRRTRRVSARKKHKHKHKYKIKSKKRRKLKHKHKHKHSHKRKSTRTHR